MKFQEFSLDKTICDALDVLGYEEALPVQEAVIPLLLQKRDVIVKSMTGSGKTASFAIPIIEDLVWNERDVQAVVLTPTRELALQIKQDFDNIGAYKRIKTLALYGKSPFRYQAQDLKQRTHVIVATPGRILDHLQQGTLHCDKVRFVVLDEADEMLAMGFIDAVKDIMQFIQHAHTTCLFSATIPPQIASLASSFMKEASTIEIPQVDQVSDHVVHYAYMVKEHEKNAFLLKLLCKEKPEACIVFAKTQEHVIQVCDFLYQANVSVDKIHGGMLQEDRIRNMRDFRLGRLRVLVASDVAARGIDIENVTHIINYDMPEKTELYVHRIGRAGRVKARGIAISLLSQFDQNRLQALQDYLGYAIEIKDKQEVEEQSVQEQALRALGVPPIQKEEKGEQLHKDTTKLYIGGGKNKKVRAGDLVGAICEIPGVCAEDIGIIQIQDTQSYVDILHGKGDMVLHALLKTTIKGKKMKVEKANQRR